MTQTIIPTIEKLLLSSLYRILLCGREQQIELSSDFEQAAKLPKAFVSDISVFRKNTSLFLRLRHSSELSLFSIVHRFRSHVITDTEINAYHGYRNNGVILS